jgi:hypothetical protein
MQEAIEEYTLLQEDRYRSIKLATNNQVMWVEVERNKVLGFALMGSTQPTNGFGGYKECVGIQTRYILMRNDPWSSFNSIYKLRQDEF